MTTRINMGIAVHATSNRVLWVVVRGVGLALALNYKNTTINNKVTNTVMTVMITSSKL